MARGLFPSDSVSTGRKEIQVRASVRVLVVAQDEVLTKSCSQTLNPRPELVVASSLDAAWDRTEQDVWALSPCDFVLLDFDLPDGDGVELLPRLHCLDPRPQVAVFCRHLGAMRSLSLHGRCSIALTKPIDGRVLEAVFQVLEETRTGTSAISSFAAHHGLSPQETRLLRLALQEVTNKEAADRLGCAHSTVRSYWARIFQKVGCRTERDVVSRLFRHARRSATAEEASFVITQVPPTALNQRGAGGRPVPVPLGRTAM